MYSVRATNKTPYLSLDLENKVITIQGRSIHEDPKGFYTELFERCNELVKTDLNAFKLVFGLTYFNSSSAIIFRDLIRLFETSTADVVIEWRYESDDDEMKSSGEEFMQLFEKVKFDFVVVD